MLPTFVIGLREGLEASLIVGVIGAFLMKEGRRDALRWMWAGVTVAVLLCVGAAVGLQILNAQLPQAQQEGLETVVAAIAVAMVSFMILWMRRHASNLAGELRASAASALARGSVWALVAMAFFAVMREGLETSVFLLAAFQVSGDSNSAWIGALLGILCSVVLGWAIYRGGVRLNLARFFRVTAAALVLVAAGLVMSAIHTAHEATWLNSLQGETINLSWLARPGTVSSALVTGVLGIQPLPTVGELGGWLLYAIPMLVIVLMPERWRRRAGTAAAVAGTVALAAILSGCGSGASGGATGSQMLKVSLVATDCSPDKLTAKSGPVTIKISSGSTGKVTELELKTLNGIILAERENLVSGISGSFSLNLQPGTYVLNCPNGTEDDSGRLVVTGNAVSIASPANAKLLKTATDTYHAFIEQQTGTLLAKTRLFVAALRAGDLAQAKNLYAPARYVYEEIEPVAESFGSLDPAIDGRVNDVVPPAKWTGFHRIEQILWVKGTTAGTGAYGTKLLADEATLDRRIKTLTFQPAQLANGAVELLNEVANSKITGEEDRYSHTDLSDFAANLEGAKEAFELLSTALVYEGYQSLADTIDFRFETVSTGLDKYRRATPLGYAFYSALTPTDRRALAVAVDALAESLSTVSAKVSE